MKWFAVEIDRNFSTGEYGDKKEIYIEVKNDNPNYIKLKHGKINSGKYTEDNKLEVDIKFSNDEDIKKLTLNDEPDHELFENTLYKDWKLWDNMYGIYDENRSDYEPWSFNSLKSLAIEMNCFEAKDNEKIQLYWNKSFQTNS